MAIIVSYYYFKFLLKYLILIFLAITSLVVFDFLHQGSEHISPEIGLIVDKHKDKVRILNSTEGQWLYYSDQHHEVGDSIRFKGNITFAEGGISHGAISLPREFNYPQWLYMKGYQGSIQSYSSVKLGTKKPALGFQIRDRLRNKIEDLDITPTSKGLLLGIYIGDRSLIGANEYQQYIDAGLVHIVAVSGSNIVYVILLSSLLLFWIPRRPRNFLLAIILSIYVALCGWDSSVLRATVLGILTLLALDSGRPLLPRRVLGFVWLLMLVYNPYLLLYDLGFSLSFSAVASIYLVLGLTKKIPRSNSWLRNICDQYIFPTVAAGSGVIPILLMFGLGFNLTSFIANVLVVPTIPLVYYFGSLALLFPDTFFGILLDSIVIYIDTIALWSVTNGRYISL